MKCGSALLLLMLLQHLSTAQRMPQTPNPPLHWQLPKTKAPASKTTRLLLHAGIIVPGIVAGIAQGQQRVIYNNKWGYRYRHPQAYERWWNPDSSWRYANGNNFWQANFGVVIRDKDHFNQAIGTVMVSTQISMVALLSVDDFKRHGWLKFGRMLLYIVEANAVRLLAKRATLEYYRLR